MSSGQAITNMGGHTPIQPMGGAEPCGEHDAPHRPRRSPEWLRRRLIAADWLAIVLGLALALTLFEMRGTVPEYIVAEHAVLAIVALPAFAIGAALNRMHLARANDRRSDELRNIIGTTSVGVGAILATGFVLQYKELSRFWVFVAAMSVFGALVVERAVARRVFTQLRSSGRLRRRIAIVGTDAHAIGLLHTYQRRPDLGYDIVGFVGPDSHAERGGVPVLGPIEQVATVLDENNAVGVVISLASVTAGEVNTLTRRLTDAGYHVALSSSLEDIDINRLRTQELDGRTMLYIEPVIREGWRGAAKRVFDVVLATAVLLLTLPILIVAAIAIRLTSRGPVLFRQARIGKDGQIFQLVKFRTMVQDAEARRSELEHLNEQDGPLFKIRQDPRITRVGRFLRKTSIDELPQLLCVLRGTMSMVGPRPALPEESAVWDDDVHERLKVLPGLTGMWQVSGRSDSSFDHYKRMDLYYVHNWSLSHDVRICTRTVKVVLMGQGAA